MLPTRRMVSAFMAFFSWGSHFFLILTEPFLNFQNTGIMPFMFFCRWVVYPHSFNLLSYPFSSQSYRNTSYCCINTFSYNSTIPFLCKFFFDSFHNLIFFCLFHFSSPSHLFFIGISVSQTPYC